MNPTSKEKMNPEDCTIGIRVRVIGAAERQGSVAALPRQIDDRWYVRVNFDDGARVNQPIDILEFLPEHLDSISEVAAGRFQGPESLRRNLLHEKLHGRLSEMMYSMETSDTNFLAYQFKPILKLLESPTNSLLIADEVGLGKTIEAGLIWTELKAREGARGLLVVCPPHLVTKWRIELKRRFGVEAQAAGPTEVLEKLEEARLNRSAGFAIVATYHGLRPPKDWEDINTGSAGRLAQKLTEWSDTEQPFVDLLVMDEAAIMRNEGSQTSKLGGLLAPISKYKIYLSATPLHTRAQNLFNLLRRLDEDTFPDMATFNGILEANAPLVGLRDALLSGKESRDDLLQRLAQASAFSLLAGNRSLAELKVQIESAPDLQNHKIRAELAYQSERANLLSYVVTRTRRRDIETNPILREVNTIKVPLTSEEARLYHRVTEAVYEYADSNGTSAGFLTVMPQRQVTSCMVAACSRLKAPETDNEEINPDRTWEVRGTPGGPLIQHISTHLGAFDLAALSRDDSKYNCFREALRMHWDQHPGSKVVLFAYFKPTLRYLKQRLLEDQIPALLLTGDEPGDKQSIVDEFAKPSSPKILLSSEVGSEGLDLQFASTLVNYDLPWNPMVVEQRIGRIHRIGQQAERIVVINLVCKDTVDERIYDRLYHRLDLFRKTLGDMEAVIGPQINDLTADLVSLRLTPVQQGQRIDQTATALQNQMRLNEDLEREAGVLAAYGDYVINRIAAAHDRGEWINGSDIEAYVLSFFRKVFPATRIQGIDSRERLFEIEFDPDASHSFDEFLSLKNLRGHTRIATQEKCRVRFDHRLFIKSAFNVEIVHQAHPLIRFIGHHLRVNRLVQPVAVAVEIPAESIAGGVEKGLFAVVCQRWSIEGLRAYERLHHELVRLDTGLPVEDDTLANAIVEAAAAEGRECGEAPQPGDAILESLGVCIDELQFTADTAFDRFLNSSKRENDDRKQIQLRGLESFEARRRTALQAVRAQHEFFGRKGLIAATDGKLEGLRRKCLEQRRRIERKQTRGESVTIAAGFILIC